MSGLVVPGHVARAAVAQRAQAEEADRQHLAWDADGIARSALPEPVGYRILVEPIEVDQKVGSVFLPEQMAADARHLVYVGKVVAFGPDAYGHAKFNGRAWCQPGDFVVYGRYAGQVAKVRGQRKVHEFKFVNDDEILATVADPSKLVIYV